MCLMLSCALASAHAADVAWDTIIRLTTNPSSQVTGYSSQRSIAVDAAGDVHVAWLDQRDVPYQAWYRRYDAGTSTWQAETALTNRQANCFRPGIACDSAGNVHLAWHVESFQGAGIWAKRHNATTHHWRADTLIDSTSTSHPQSYPSVACVPGTGDVAVAWYGSPDTGMNSQVFLRERHSATGWDTAMQVSEAPTSHDQVSAAASRNGDLAVVWIGKDFGNDYNQVYCRRRVGGTWQGTELVSGIPSGLTQYSPCVAFDQEGVVHVAWHGRSMMNTYQQVFHRECSQSGWSGIDSVSGVRAWQQEFPSVAGDAVGRCHVVWCGKAGSEHKQLVYGQRDTNGVWSSPVTLTGLDSGDVSQPSIVCDSDSDIHIVWHDASSGNPDVYYLRGAVSGSGAIGEVHGRQSTRTRAASTVAWCCFLVQQPGAMMFDACGRSARMAAPGVYFVRSAGSSRLIRLVVVR